MSTERRIDRCECGWSFCCGCIGHPAGKPWGWAADAWVEHDKTCPAPEPPS